MEPIRRTGVSGLAGQTVISVISYVRHQPSAIRHPIVNRRNILALTMAVTLATACRRDPVFQEMSDSTFVKTMVALRTLPIGPADTVIRARQRDSILKAFGVTAAQMESVAVRLSNDPARAAEIFRAIENPSVSSPP